MGLLFMPVLLPPLHSPPLGRNLLSCQEGLRPSVEALKAFRIADLGASLARSPW